MDIDSSLLREKFIIKEKSTDKDGKMLEIICQGTRMPISLSAGEREPETYVIRSHNMHTTVQMVANVINEYQKRGPLMNRATPLDWSALWSKSVSDYENAHNKNKWVCVYHNGSIIFSTGEHHQFLDIIEKCDIVNNGNYETSVKLAKEAFSHAGTQVDINYDGNFALIVDLNDKGGRCSLVLRGTEKTTTFNYTIAPITGNEKIDIPKVISIAANFLEGVQLAFIIGNHNKRLNLSIMKESSENEKKLRDAEARVDSLNYKINMLEKQYIVNYRTERPNFYELIEFAENYSKK